MNYYLIIYWCVYFVIDTIVLITAIILTTFTTIKQAKLIKKELEEEKQLYGKTLLGMQSASDDVELADLQSPKYNLDGTPKTPADRKSLAQ
jgi:ABC-type protease/lipase transport system fused ATPase/permease subunit